jgi:hypothetical protein
MSERMKRWAQPILTVALVGVLTIPAWGLLSSSRMTESSLAGVNGSGGESVADLIADGSMGNLGNDAMSPVASLLMANTVANPFGGPPFFHFGDVNADGCTDLFDFLIIKANFGISGDNVVRGDGDVTGDRFVRPDDFFILKKFFGVCSPYTGFFP